MNNGMNRHKKIVAFNDFMSKVMDIACVIWAVAWTVTGLVTVIKGLFVNFLFVFIFTVPAYLYLYTRKNYYMEKFQTRMKTK